jgi:hypothetical protein
MEPIGYKTETKMIMFQGKLIPYTSVSPIFTPEDEERNRRELEEALYDILIKYEKPGE